MARRQVKQLQMRSGKITFGRKEYTTFLCRKPQVSCLLIAISSVLIRSRLEYRLSAGLCHGSILIQRKSVFTFNTIAKLH